MSFLLLVAMTFMLVTSGEALGLYVITGLVGCCASLYLLIKGWPTLALLFDSLSGAAKIDGSTAQKVWFWLELVFYVQILALPPWIFRNKDRSIFCKY